MSWDKLTDSLKVLKDCSAELLKDAIHSAAIDPINSVRQLCGKSQVDWFHPDDTATGAKEVCKHAGDMAGKIFDFMVLRKIVGGIAGEGLFAKEVAAVAPSTLTARSIGLSAVSGFGQGHLLTPVETGYSGLFSRDRFISGVVTAGSVVTMELTPHAFNRVRCLRNVPHNFIGNLGRNSTAGAAGGVSQVLLSDGLFKQRLGLNLETVGEIGSAAWGGAIGGGVFHMTHAALGSACKFAFSKRAAAPIAIEAVAVDKPAVEKPAVEKPAVEKPAVEKPDVEKPAAEKPAAEKPAAEKPAAEKPAAEKPAAEKPAAEKPAVEKPAVEKAEQARLEAHSKAAREAEKAQRRPAAIEARRQEERAAQREQDRINQQRNEAARQARAVAAQEQAALKEQAQKKAAERQQAARDKAAANQLAANEAARNKLQAERADWEKNKRPPAKVWMTYEKQIAQQPPADYTHSSRGDKAQNELFNWTMQDLQPSSRTAGDRLPLFQLRDAVRGQMEKGGWALVQTGKNSLADEAGMDYILANKRDGRYFFLDATLDVQSKSRLPDLRRNGVVPIELDEYRSPTLGSKTKFLQLLHQCMQQQSPLNLSDTPPPSLAPNLSLAESETELGRFRKSIATKVRWLEHDAEELMAAGQSADTQFHCRTAGLLREYNCDLQRVIKYVSSQSEKAADPAYGEKLAAFQRQVIRSAALSLRHYLSRGTMSKGAPDISRSNLTVCDQQGREFVYDFRADKLFFQTPGRHRYEISGLEGRMNELLPRIERETFKDSGSKNTVGTDRYALKRAYTSTRSQERLALIKDVLNRLSLLADSELLGQ